MTGKYCARMLLFMLYFPMLTDMYYVRGPCDVFLVPSVGKGMSYMFGDFCRYYVGSFFPLGFYLTRKYL